MFNFLLEYFCFTMLCQFLLYSTVNRLCIYIYPLSFGLPSHLGYHRALSRVPCAIEQILVSYLLYIWQCIYAKPYLPIHPNLFPFPLGVHRFVLYVCVSIPILQISSAIPFFQIPHICVNITICFSLSDLTSLCIAGSRFIHLITN